MSCISGFKSRDDLIEKIVVAMKQLQNKKVTPYRIVLTPESKKLLGSCNYFLGVQVFEGVINKVCSSPIYNVQIVIENGI
jgi:hypothetical protein